MTYYKVLQRFCPPIYDTYGEESFQGLTQRCIYKLGQWTEAPGNSGLLVFDNLMDARFFQTPDDQRPIVECECEEPIELPTYRLELWHHVKRLTVSELDWDKLGRDAIRENEQYPSVIINGWCLGVLSGWPIGTLAFRRVRPLKVVG